MKRKTIKYNELKVGHVVEWHFDGSSGIAAIKEFVST